MPPSAAPNHEGLKPMTTSYKNPWHNPLDRYSGPDCFMTDVKPTEYKGYLIYHRLSDVWDVVKDDACVTQRAGFNGAKRYIDEMVEASALFGEINQYFESRA